MLGSRNQRQLRVAATASESANPDCYTLSTLRLLNCEPFSYPGARVTAWRRAGREVGALPRSLYRRTSVAVPVRTFLRSTRVPAGDEAGIGRLGLLDPAPLLARGGS